MKKCNNCNYIANDNEFYCPNCGSKLIKSKLISLILSIIATALVAIGVNIVINVISIVLGITSIVLALIKEGKNKWSIGLGMFSILGSTIWILFNFVN